MRVAAGLVIEGIENRERRRAFLNGKPGFTRGSLTTDHHPEPNIEN